ncbi:MAG TPA: hypothetical protein VI318_23455 [Baekduia sp.]
MLGNPLLTVLVLAADGASGSGGKDAGESASAWDPGGFLFWMVLVLALLAVLIGGLAWNARRGGGGSGDDEDAATGGDAPRPSRAPSPAMPRRVEHVEPREGWELAVLTFPGLHGAERAYAKVEPRTSADAWTRDLAFAEGHRHGRVVVRGTVGGHYVDVQDLAVSEGETPLLTELRADVPEGSSALVAYAPHDEVDALVGALADRPHDLHRHRADAAEVSALARAVSGAPAATAPRSDGAGR